MALASVSCSNESSFSGSGKFRKPSKDSSLDGNNPLPDGGNIPDPVNLNDCKTGAAIEDPNATFGFASGSEIVAFVNGFGTYTTIPTEKWNAGSAFANQATADAICKLKGYVRGNITATRRYSSCSDNNHGVWIESLKNFQIQNACVDNSNKNLNGLTCTGKLKDPCAKDPSWVFDKN